MDEKRQKRIAADALWYVATYEELSVAADLVEERGFKFAAGVLRERREGLTRVHLGYAGSATSVAQRTVACGGVTDLRTDDPFLVTCRSCRRTKRWREEAVAERKKNLAAHKEKEECTES